MIIWLYEFLHEFFLRTRAAAQQRLQHAHNSLKDTYIEFELSDISINAAAAVTGVYLPPSA